MPVTITPATHGADTIKSKGDPVKTPQDILNRACPKEGADCVELLQSSFDSNFNPVIQPSANGFVHGVILAYNQHHHLQIRPEDVWFAIISQLSFYINAHAEELRGMFVTHKGKKELVVKFEQGNRYTVDFGLFAQLMSGLIEENVVDPELRKWVMPAFSTSTRHDNIIASILLMGVTQKYFEFTCCMLCGLPSVTLMGEKADWELIYQRLAKIDTFGEEPAQFSKLLRPVISHFLKSFDEPASADIVNFWQRIAHHHRQGSGSSFYSGWITAFCFWDADGVSMYRVPTDRGDPERFAREKARFPSLELDGVSYHWIVSDKVPPGYSSVPVTINDNGAVYQATMVAGSVGINCTGSERENSESSTDLDTVSAQTGWWMFERKS